MDPRGYELRAVHGHLLAHARAPAPIHGQIPGPSQGQSHALASILATWSCGGGALPAWLGLGADGFAALLCHHFPGAWVRPRPQAPGIDPRRSAEIGDLRDLMLAHRAGRSVSEEWTAGIVASACMGADHLWQDLGLWSRPDLTTLLYANFPGLACANAHDMKWKKFLYRQLCAAQHLRVCRAPSCEVCVDYADCFGSED